jgi:hypothetical protein
VDTEVAPELLEAPPLPTHAVPGSLGGPCGKDYAKCKTGEAMAKKFRELKISSLKQTSCVDDGSANTEVVYTYRLPKLVNDHSGSSDNMQLTAFLSWSSSQSVLTLSLERNGAQVYSGYAYNMDTNSRVFAHEDDQFVDVYLGGLEAVLTLQNKTISDSVLNGLARCHWPENLRDIPPRSGQPPYNAVGAHCVSCYLGRGAITVAFTVAGGLAGRAVKAGTTAMLALAGVGSAAGQFINSFLDCPKLCRIENCNAAVRDCVDANCRTLNGDAFQDCLLVCDEGLSRCCGSEGGRCVMFDDKRCNFCISKL